MDMVVEIASWAFVSLGSFFVVCGAIGILRMPDIYTRLHSASVIDTTGAGFLVLGMILQAGWSLVTLKLVFVLAIFFFTLPVASHALARAALHEGIAPVLKEDRSGARRSGDAATDAKH
nr:MAG: monovalent cation/H(+) antiporter subunit G [Hyphomicrobiales bacterium]